MFTAEKRQRERESKWPQLIHCVQINIYIVNAVNEWIVTTVAHRKPITAKPHDVDVLVFVDIGPRDV